MQYISFYAVTPVVTVTKSDTDQHVNVVTTATDETTQTQTSTTQDLESLTVSVIFFKRG